MAAVKGEGEVHENGAAAMPARKRESSKRRERSEADESPLTHVAPGEMVNQVTAFARENPHLALAGAVAVGFVLGGGLTPRLVGAVGMFAARRYLGGAMREAVETVLREVDDVTSTVKG
jgi:ElaB/YqjD/DUF883 family membrane-anchored ribosome-binding protein